MSEELTEAQPPETFHEATSTDEAELARKNLRWGWALFGLFWVLFAGTIGVA